MEPRDFILRMYNYGVAMKIKISFVWTATEGRIQEMGVDWSLL